LGVGKTVAKNAPLGGRKNRGKEPIANQLKQGKKGTVKGDNAGPAVPNQEKKKTASVPQTPPGAAFTRDVHQKSWGATI